METAIRRLEQRSEREAVWVSLIWIAVVLCLFAAARLLRLGPQETLLAGGFELPQLCWFRAMFAADCPGCGLTRCFVLAARLRLAEAWAMHPIGMLFAGYLAATVPLRVWRLACLATATATPSTLRWELLLVAGLITAAYFRWLALQIGWL
jgi:hypothetical protein